MGEPAGCEPRRIPETNTMKTNTNEQVRQTVRARYGEIGATSGTCCAGPSCGAAASHDPAELSRRIGYSEE